MKYLFHIHSFFRKLFLAIAGNSRNRLLIFSKKKILVYWITIKKRSEAKRSMHCPAITTAYVRNSLLVCQFFLQIANNILPRWNYLQTTTQTLD